MSKRVSFESLLRIRDKQIEDLKNKNELLTRVAIKRSQALQEMMERMAALIEENKKLKEKARNDK